MATDRPATLTRQTLIVIGLTLLTAVLVLLTWYTSSVWLLAFFGVLLGVMLKGMADQVRKRTNLGKGWSLAIVVVVLIVVLGGLTVLAGRTLVNQTHELTKQLPTAYDSALKKVSHWPIIGQTLTAQDDAKQAAAATQPAEKTSERSEKQLSDAIQSAAPPVSRAVGTVFGTVANVVVSFVTVSVVAIYVASTPGVYAGGLVALFPRRVRPRAREVVSAVVYTLQQWLLGQGLTMLVIGTVTGAGLYFIGVKLWLLFGVLAGLFNFIPNFGPLISFIPAVLVAWSDDPSKVWWVVGLYIVAQTLEGYVLTPMVQKWAVDTPPAVLIVAQVLSGVLFGALGVMMAAPLLSIVIVVVKMLWVEDVLGDESDAADDEPRVQKMAAKLQRADNPPKAD